MSATATLTQPSFVPREALGQARAYRTALLRQDSLYSAAMRSVLRPIQMRIRQGCIPRAELLADAAAAWGTQLPECGRLSLAISHSANRFSVQELRISAAEVRLDQWADADKEPGFALLLIGISLHRRKVVIEDALLAGLSLHAVARWFQRNWDNTETALSADLRQIATATDLADRDPDSRFLIPVDGGRWAGRVTLFDDDAQPVKVLNIRTFLTAS